MLHPPTDDEWMPQPGNPNFLVRRVGVVSSATKKRAMKEEKEPPKEKQVEEEEMIPVPPPPKEKEEEEEETPPKKKVAMGGPTDFEQQAALILRESLEPLYTFVGMLEAESGKTLYYRYVPNLSMEDRKVPINFGAANRAEFIARNPQLSLPLKEALYPNDNYIGVNMNNVPVHYPAWFWAMMESPVFRFLLDSSTFGAMQLAANELGFELKDLIYSPHVNYMFAQFVARKFISPKNNAYAAGMQGGQMQYRISSGFNTSQMANTKWLLGCREWFRNVYYTENPVRADELDRKIAEQAAKVADYGPNVNDAQRRQKEIDEEELRRLQNVRATLSGRVLKPFTTPRSSRV